MALVSPPGVLDTLSPCEFVQLLVDETPHFHEELLKDVRPTDGEVGHYASGTWPAFGGNMMFQDRVNHVAVNVARPWNRVAYESCVGRPCCKVENEIGYGATRIPFFLEEISYSSPQMCFDQQIHVSHVVEHMEYIISKILKPTPMQVQSMWLRKHSLRVAKHRFVCRADFGQPSSEMNHIWQLDANGNEVFMLTDQMPDSGITPQMLQRRVGPLRRIGYQGENPFKEREQLPLIELVTGEHTLWDLEHLVGQSGGGGSPTLPNNWRFTSWDAASEFWRYGFSGQIGDYMARVDAFEMRFCYVGPSGDATYPYKFRLILPYKNIVSSGAGGAAGLKSEDDPAFETAPYRFTRVTHMRGLEMLTQETASINPMLPYLRRDFGGKWQAVLPHVKVDESGVVTSIDNRRGNIVQLLMDLQMGVRPMQTEWLEWYFHLAAPACVTPYTPCGVSEGYCLEQDINMKNDPCPTPDLSITFTPVLDDGVTPNVYHIEANTITCDGAPINHGDLQSATLAGLVDLLNAQLATLGTWAVSGGNILLTYSSCATVNIPWAHTEE